MNQYDAVGILIAGIILCSLAAVVLYLIDLKESDDLAKVDRFLPNIKSCSDLIRFKYYEISEKGARDKVDGVYREQCVIPVFGSPHPSESKIIEVFSKMECGDLYGYVGIYRDRDFYKYASDEISWGHCKNE